MGMRDVRAAGAASRRSRSGGGRAGVPASVFLFATLCLAVLTAMGVYFAATLCIWTCQPWSERLPGMVLIGGIGTVLVLLHAAVGASFLMGRPAARYAGILIGVVWIGLPTAMLLRPAPGQTAGPGPELAIVLYGLVMLIVSLAPLPEAKAAA